MMARREVGGEDHRSLAVGDPLVPHAVLGVVDDDGLALGFLERFFTCFVGRVVGAPGQVQPIE